ncbi:MAG TPA: PTS mannose transporter subunit IIAB [Candidatus Limnocylindria bacterium]
MTADGGELLPVLLVGHGPLAAGLLGAVEMIAGPQERCAVVRLRPEDDIERVSKRLEAELRRMGVADDDDGLIFADLFGAAPANAAAMLLRTRPNLEIVAGMNLPMVVDALLSREGMSAKDLCRQALASGQESIRDVGAVVRAALAGSNTAGADT